MTSKRPNLFLPSVTLGVLLAFALVSIYGCSDSRLDPNPPRARLKIDGAVESKPPLTTSGPLNDKSATTLRTRIKPRNATTLGQTRDQIRSRGGMTMRSRNGTTIRSRNGTTLRGRSGTTTRRRSNTTSRGRSGTTLQNRK